MTTYPEFPFEVDADDPMEVDLAGPCSLCASPVSPQTGVCGNGHDDLDRADPWCPCGDQPISRRYS